MVSHFPLSTDVKKKTLFFKKKETSNFPSMY